MSDIELYTKEARVWLPDDENVWKSACLLSDYKGLGTILKIQTDDDGEDIELTIKTKNDLPPLRNPEILAGENDLTSLSYLHEPAVLHNLQVRFVERNVIYTYCGIVLVAINPYEQLSIYDQDTMMAYRGQDMGSLEPHIFAVADEAFKRLSNYNESQSIIVSGESGAGKTVSAKYAMRYFATICGNQNETQIEKRVLSSNPIMEAIGNAKTTRNDNSSRFGKYIELGFDKSNSLIGANMRTYLLEKSRVVFQSANERNYHIFYQLCAVADLDEYKEFTLAEPDMFLYTNQGEDPLIDGVNDQETFNETIEAFKILGFDEKTRYNLLKIIAGILHLGNVVFKEEDNESCMISKKDKHLPIMARLFDIDETSIGRWLCMKRIATGNEVFEKPLSKNQAFFSKDALAKHIYSLFFQYIVEMVNERLNITKKHSKFIGVLDIYGFETFEINSFEQFCINYANEKLQQQFCLHVFKLEQDEYIKEEIEWSFIDFYDNQPCIDLIEGKLGILELLNEECKMPKGSDANWCLKLASKHSQNKHFTVPRMRQKSFVIHHFADNVEYLTDGFLEKNRDTVLEEQIKIFKNSKNEFIKQIFEEEEDRLKKKSTSVIRSSRDSQRGSKSHKFTVAWQFKISLTDLMTTLFSTTPHYIRCIKPNDTKTAFNFEPKRAVQQLRACGVLETIRISAAGYPSRWKYVDFFQRYKLLLKMKNIDRKNFRKSSELILNALITDKDKYQFGKTQIFFRAGQVAYLEKLRMDKCKSSAISIQRITKGWLQRRKYKKLQKSVLLVQSYGRGLLARRYATILKRTHAAVVLQSAFRRCTAAKRYDTIRKLVALLQTYAKAKLARVNYRNMVLLSKTVVLQSAIRMWLSRRKFTICTKGIVRLQAHVRRRIAKRELKRLKVEARSVEGIQKVAKGLENKVISLQMKLDVQKAENIELKKSSEESMSTLRKDNERLKTIEIDWKNLTNKIQELEKIIKELEIELIKEKENGEKISNDFKTYRMNSESSLDIIKEEKFKLEEEIKELKEITTSGNNYKLSPVASRRESPTTSLNEKMSQVEVELDTERRRHQKLLNDYNLLKEKYSDLLLQDQHLDVVQPKVKGHVRNLSDISNISFDIESGVGSDKSSETGTLPRKTEQKKNGEQMSNGDLFLIIRLQTRIRFLENDKAKLEKLFDQKQEINEMKKDLNVFTGSNDEAIKNSICLQELQMENNKLKSDLTKLRASIVEDQDKGLTSFLDQYEALSAELERRREECIQLRTMITSMNLPKATDNLKKDGGDDGELELAYNSQKELNTLLKTQLEQAEEREKEILKELDRIRQDCNQYEKQLSKNWESNLEGLVNSTLQYQVSKLTLENLDLKESYDNQQKMIKKLKKALKIYAKKLKNEETPDIVVADMDFEDVPEIRHHSNRQYLGMFDYRIEDEPLLMKNLILDLEPSLALKQNIPSLPAYIIFMCVRHGDYLNDTEKVSSMMTNTFNSIKSVVKSRQKEEMGVMVMWLGNVCRLLNHMKQYSGEKEFQKKNTPKQNEQCLRNFDLLQFRQILQDIAVWIYQGLIKYLEKKLQPLIVSGVLEHEGIAGLSANKPSGLRGRIYSNDSEGKGDEREDGLAKLLKCLDEFLEILNKHSLEMEIINQIFRQLFYCICANSLNNLLLKKDMCHWGKGMQIRYNITHLEQWVRDNKLTISTEVLVPIIEATQLLQARKSDEDVDSICGMCCTLKAVQIIKILNLYTPVNDFEERVPVSFIKKIQVKLNELKATSSTTTSAFDHQQQQQLLMDTKFNFAVTFPFSPTSIGFESIELPDDWKLDFLKRL